jgi:hypothetical protein
MADFTLDRVGLAFSSFALVLVCWAVFDTPRFARVVSFNRILALTRFRLMSIRVPGTVVILGLIWLILATLLRKR